MKNLIIFTLLLISFSGYAQTPDEIGQKLFNDIETEGIKQALNNAPKDSAMSNPVKLENIINQFSIQKSKLGKYYGYEKYNTDEVAKCIIIQSYILKFQNSPAQLNIAFYKPNDTWLIHKITIKKFINNKRARM